MTDTAAKRATFRALHAEGCFVLPDPWDIGSARLFQHMGFSALASTSSGHAWTTGRPDYGVTRDDALAHLTALCAAVDLPVNADFESGFAVEPEGVAANVRLAVQTGVAGLSIEDSKPDGVGSAGSAVGGGAHPCSARSDRCVRTGRDPGGPHRGPAGRRGHGHRRHRPAGGLCGGRRRLPLCAGCEGQGRYRRHGAGGRAQAAECAGDGAGSFGAELAALGVRRVSVGGALARVAWGAVQAAARQIQEGSFAGLAGAASGKELNGIFAGFVKED